MIDAFPTQISGVPLSYEGSTIAKVEVEFTYSRFVYEMNPATRISPAGTRPSVKMDDTIGSPDLSRSISTLA